MHTMYGIPNCDSCKKARKWLEANDITYRFHDVRADGLEKSHFDRWLLSVAWDKLLNTRSTTWRGLPADVRANVDQKSVIRLLVEHPTLVKRPVLDDHEMVIVGFSQERYEEVLG